MESVRLELATDAFALEQVADLLRSVLCGELHLARAVVEDGFDRLELCRVLLAWDGPKPVATVRLRRDGDKALLEHLAVLPSHRRRGLGRRLIQAAGRLAREAGQSELYCVAPASVDPFFQSCGFVALKRESGITLWRGLLI